MGAGPGRPSAKEADRAGGCTQIQHGLGAARAARKVECRRRLGVGSGREVVVESAHRKILHQAALTARATPVRRRWCAMEEQFTIVEVVVPRDETPPKPEKE